MPRLLTLISQYPGKIESFIPISCTGIGKSTAHIGPLDWGIRPASRMHLTDGGVGVISNDLLCDLWLMSGDQI